MHLSGKMGNRLNNASTKEQNTLKLTAGLMKLKIQHAESLGLRNVTFNNKVYWLPELKNELHKTQRLIESKK